MNTYPKPKYLDEYSQWLRTQGKASGTIQEYAYQLSRIPEEVEIYFADPHLQGKPIKFAAYRSYLAFLTKKKKLLSKEELMDALDTFKPPKKRGNNHSERKFSISRDKWTDHIRMVPSRVGKMGCWIGFHFGLRLNEILHLRVQDINFKDQLVLIRSHRKAKTHEAWYPKYMRERQIPFTKDQGDTLDRWINEIRPKDLPHSYLLWTERGPRKYLIVQDRAFQRWMNKAGIHPHVLRYSFATHYYNESKDVKLISDLLGHSNVSTTSEYLQLGQKETMTKARALFAQT